MDFIWETPTEVAYNLAKRLRRVRKRKKITQKDLACRSNVSYVSLRKFEETGQISLISLIKLCMELGVLNEINELFTQPVYTSIEEVIRDAEIFLQDNQTVGKKLQKKTKESDSHETSII